MLATGIVGDARPKFGAGFGVHNNSSNVVGPVVESQDIRLHDFPFTILGITAGGFSVIEDTFEAGIRKAGYNRCLRQEPLESGRFEGLDDNTALLTYTG